MVKQDFSKYHTLYHICKCSKDIIIPTNDVDAWQYYTEHNWIYNRLIVAQLQNIKTAPMPTHPDNFPIILKPIINLYGMGLNSFKISNNEEFMNHWYSNHFWSEYFEGDNYSYDILILNGKPIWHCCFRGHKLDNNLGSFQYWESLEMELPENAKYIIEKLNNYTGCLNMEVIDGKIIECHLRMGDINKLPNKEIMPGIIKIYSGENFEFPSEIPKIYLFPIWISTDIDTTFVKQINPAIIATICHNAYSFQIDKCTEACPDGLRRIMIISVLDYDSGIEIVNQIYSYLHSI